MRVWDARDPRRARSPIEFSLSEHAKSVSYDRSSDDRFVLRRSKERYTVWDLSDPAPEPAICWTVDDPNDSYREVQFSRGGQRLVARSFRRVVLFDLEQTGELTPAAATPAIDSNWIEEAVLSGDGETLYCGHRDGRISVWDVRSGLEAALRGIHAGHEGEILTLCLDPNEHWLASAAKDGTVRLWDARAEFGDASGPVLPFPKKFDMLRFCDVLRFAGRSRWLLTPGGLVWDLEAERPADTQRAIGGGDADVLDIDPSDRWVVMVSDRDGALAYDLERSDPWSEPRRLALDGSQCAAWTFDPRGRRFAVGLGSGYIHVWDLLVEDAAAAKTVIDSHRRAVQSLAFSPDGRRLVSASWDTTVRIWNVEAEEPATTEVVLHTGPAGIGHVQLSRDGRWLMTGGDEGEVLFWHDRVEELLQIARDIVGRNLAPEEWSRFFGATPYRRTFPELPQGQVDRALLLGR
jgi:WD40 repeat protein